MVLAGLAAWSTAFLVALGFFPHPAIVDGLNHYLGSATTKKVLDVAKGLAALVRQAVMLSGMQCTSSPAFPFGVWRLSLRN